MNLFDVNDELYEANCDTVSKVLVNQGGTSSGKTYCIMQRLIEISVNEPRAVVTVAGQDLPNLKVGAMRDTDTILSMNAWLSKWFTVNRSGNYLRGMNGSLIEFKSYDSPQDAKSGKRDYLFVNEANGISYEVYWQLAIRTRKRIWLDYNPSARFWVHDQVIGREGVRLIISDHRGNRFLSDEEHRKIEGISDRELWEVYARGLTGKVQGLVLTDWQICDALPPREEWKMSCRGLDFGFSNDPSALEHVVLAHGDLWIDEEIYSTGLTNTMLAEKARTAGVAHDDQIIADSAEPKSIAELRAEGLWVTPSVKGRDSIIVGLDILRRYKLHITRRSLGLLDNVRRYSWSKDREGNMTNKPEDSNNHGIDAVRYVALAKLNVSRPARGVKRMN